MKSLPIFVSSRIQAPAQAPVLIAVVSNDINFMWSVRLHSWTKLNTDVASASPVPFGNFGTPSNFHDPSPDTRTARRSTDSFDSRAGNMFPSQCIVSKQFGVKDACNSFAAVSRCCRLAFRIDSLLSTMLDGLWPSDSAAAARTYVAFLLLVFVRPNNSTNQ